MPIKFPDELTGSTEWRGRGRNRKADAAARIVPAELIKQYNAGRHRSMVMSDKAGEHYVLMNMANYQCLVERAHCRDNHQAFAGGAADIINGKTQPLADAIADMRSRLSIPPRDDRVKRHPVRDVHISNRAQSELEWIVTVLAERHSEKRAKRWFEAAVQQLQKLNPRYPPFRTPRLAGIVPYMPQVKYIGILPQPRFQALLMCVSDKIYILSIRRCRYDESHLTDVEDWLTNTFDDRVSPVELSEYRTRQLQEQNPNATSEEDSQKSSSREIWKSQCSSAT